MTNYRKKLIEVALPLEAINKESAREKSIRHGHPSTLHLWWARRPLAACRAVLFASLVDDPSSWPERFKTEKDQEEERSRIFDVIEELVLWKNSNNTDVLNRARYEIARSIAWNRGEEPPTRPNEIIDYLVAYAPPVLDPFCGGGSIPLEAQRLGLKAHGSDLNPVAVLITKALIEIPPKFVGKPPINPESRKEFGHSGAWKRATGLAEDVRYYGKWMRDEAEKRIGHLYPKIKLTEEQGGGEATVIAWIWARTVQCPNPACKAQMPLVRSFALLTKHGKESWVEPIIDKKTKSVSFVVQTGGETPPEGTVKRQGAKCIVCESSVSFDHIRTEGKSGRMYNQLMAIVAEKIRGRVYISPNVTHANCPASTIPSWRPESELSGKAAVNVPLYGMKKHADLFTQRQLVALTTFSDLVGEAREEALADARKAGLTDDNKGINDGGIGAAAYADAVATYLAFAVDKGANIWSTITSWMSDRGALRETFARQAIPMVWDFAEANPFSESGGNLNMFLERIADAVSNSCDGPIGVSRQLDATAAINGVSFPIVCTDPPYYDNIGYADLSDYFYVWMRRSLGAIYSDLFSTLLVPKAQELVATPYRFDGDKEKAKQFFEDGLGRSFSRMREAQNQAFPLTVFYAFKQSETDKENDDSRSDIASTGWETMLEGLLMAGFEVTGTWPMRTEGSGRAVAQSTNSLASSIVLCCRPRPANASMATRREFATELKKELPAALKGLQHSYIAPVDLAQAVIGPGMAVFSRYSKVIEADGSRMSVRTALQIINQELDTFFATQEGDLDADTRFCLTWFEQHSMDEASFGEADVLARAKNTSVQGLVEAGVLHSKAGKVRILPRSEYSDDWDPAADKRLTVWECAQHLIRRLERGEADAAQLTKRLGTGRSEDARALAYRLYSICERKKWSHEALAYNSLVVAWPEILKLARDMKSETVVQEDAFKQEGN